MTYNLFIGADNSTGVLDLNTIQSVLDQIVDGYTITPADGVWQGKHEESCIVTVAGERSKIMQGIKELKAALRQDAIGYQRAPELRFA